MVSEACLTSMAKYDTPTICNVIELWDMRPRNTGYMDGSIQACFPHLPPMVGYAVTSTFRSMAPPRSGDVYSSLSQQVEEFGNLPGPAVVVYQDLDEPTASATFGEVMCRVYQAYGAKGIVTSGAGRDLEQVEAIKFPAFTGGTMCAHGYCHTLAINVPVSVGGMAIYPGDLLHGDCNGITTIPTDIASEIPDACEELIAAEKAVMDYVAGKNLTSKGLADARGEHSRLIQKLRDRLRGSKKA